MLLMNFRALVLILIMFSTFQHARAQDTLYPEYDTASPELNDIQRVINETLPDIEVLLKQKGTFRPFASVIMANDSIADIDVADSSKKEYSADDLKEELSIGALKGLYKVVVVFYQSSVTDPGDGRKKKVIAIFAEHTNDDFAYLFYYPYSVTPKKEVIFEDSFGDFAPQVMFKP